MGNSTDVPRTGNALLPSDAPRDFSLGQITLDDKALLLRMTARQYELDWATDSRPGKGVMIWCRKREYTVLGKSPDCLRSSKPGDVHPQKTNTQSLPAVDGTPPNSQQLLQKRYFSFCSLQRLA